MSKLKELWNKLKTDKNILLVAACVLAAVVVGVSVWGNFDKKVQQSLESQSYIDVLSNRIVSVIQKIDGCGKADVVISCATEGACEYAYETKSQTIGETTTTTTTLVTVKGEPLVTKTYTPQVYGVVIVAEGAADPAVKVKIINAVVTLLDVGAENVRVFTYKV